MDILNLAGGLGVEVDELLSGWCSSGLLVVGGKSREERVGLLSDTIGLVNRAGFVGGVVLVVEAIDLDQKRVETPCFWSRSMARWMAWSPRT